LTVPDDSRLLAAHDEALSAMSETVHAISAAHWTDATPCEGWSVRQLVNHVTVGNLWVGRLVRGDTVDSVGSSLDGDQLGTDPADAFDGSAEVARAAFGEPGALQRPCAVSYGPVPASVYLGHRLLDVLVHGWDLRVATRRPTVLPPDAVEIAWATLAPQLAVLQASGEFGAPVPVDDADPPDARLLGALGRDPELSFDE
jgi:uncharacterized protein (TIGR03086 family)